MELSFVVSPGRPIGWQGRLSEELATSLCREEEALRAWKTSLRAVCSWGGGGHVFKALRHSIISLGVSRDSYLVQW